MLKKRYIKRVYIEEAICDKCGSKMRFNGVVLTTYPAQFPYTCVNPDCGHVEIFYDDEKPGIIRYELEDEDEV
jgi:hypothetical protein